MTESGTALRMFEHVVLEVNGVLDTQLFLNFVDQLGSVNFASVVFFVDLKQARILRFGFHYDVKNNKSKKFACYEI